MSEFLLSVLKYTASSQLSGKEIYCMAPILFGTEDWYHKLQIWITFIFKPVMSFSVQRCRKGTDSLVRFAVVINNKKCDSLFGDNKTSILALCLCHTLSFHILYTKNALHVYYIITHKTFTFPQTTCLLIQNLIIKMRS